jgi:CheY-like chemotaxis protein
MNMEYSILVVDDDPDDCQIIEESLYQAGWKYSVEFAIGGLEALKSLESQRTSGTLPVMIILDVNMPAMNGLEVLAKLKENDFYRHIPVILYSTSCSDDLILKSKALGAHDCAKKGTSYTDNIKFARRVLALINSTRS